MEDINELTEFFVEETPIGAIKSARPTLGRTRMDENKNVRGRP